MPGCVVIAVFVMCVASNEIGETLYYQWRDRLLEGGKTALATPRDATVDPKRSSCAKRRSGSASSSGRSAARPTSWRSWGTLSDWTWSVRVCPEPCVLWSLPDANQLSSPRVARISRQALYRPIAARPAAAGPGRGRPGDAGIVEVAEPTRPTARGWSLRSPHVSSVSR